MRAITISKRDRQEKSLWRQPRWSAKTAGLTLKHELCSLQPPDARSSFYPDPYYYIIISYHYYHHSHKAFKWICIYQSTGNEVEWKQQMKKKPCMANLSAFIHVLNRVFHIIFTAMFPWRANDHYLYQVAAFCQSILVKQTQNNTIPFSNHETHGVFF